MDKLSVLAAVIVIIPKMTVTKILGVEGHKITLARDELGFVIVSDVLIVVVHMPVAEAVASEVNPVVLGFVEAIEIDDIEGSGVCWEQSFVVVADIKVDYARVRIPVVLNFAFFAISPAKLAARQRGTDVVPTDAVFIIRTSEVLDGLSSVGFDVGTVALQQADVFVDVNHR